MMMPLEYTSCLFATVVIAAYHHPNSGSFRVTCYHHLFLLVTVLSILFHCTHRARIGTADKICAHAAFVFVVVYDLRQAIEGGAWWLLLFPLAVALLWIGEMRWPARANLLHACLHAVSVVGVNCYLIRLQ